MVEISRPSIFWQSGLLDRRSREAFIRQRALTIWLTGLSASGKSTTAYAIENLLFQQGCLCYVLDGDNLRHGINCNLGFGEEDRKENVRRTAEVARLMNDAGLVVIVSLISPRAADRGMAKEIIGGENFFEVFLSTPLEVCEARDPKSLYKRARQGMIENFTGISAPYEPPVAADLAISTFDMSPEDVAKTIVSMAASRIGR